MMTVKKWRGGEAVWAASVCEQVRDLPRTRFNTHIDAHSSGHYAGRDYRNPRP
jgi:hypothetical protein